MGADPVHGPHGGGRTLGRYVIYDEFASGGMASVCFGRLSGPVGFSRPVAIKRLHPHLAKDPEFVAMFLDEARLAARVRHPNVVPTLDVVALEGEVFIVMEYVLGESLSKLVRTQLKRGGRVPVPFALACVAGALHGLHAAHTAVDEQGNALGLVHRDVSPQNVLVGSDGVPRMLDFGVAKAVGRLQDTRDGALKGKVAYMPPEQIMSHEVSPASDVYSAAVVLWELLCGRRLYEGANEAAVVAKVLAQIVESDIPKPSTFNPEVSPELDAIVMRGLAAKSEERFGSAREMAQRIEKNGGLVAASELGDWVESLAAEVLTGRSARIRAIEAGGSAPEVGDAGPPSTPSGVSSTRSGKEELSTRARQALAAVGASISPPASADGVRDAETLVGDLSTGVGLTVGQPAPSRPSRKGRVIVAVLALVAITAASSFVAFVVLRARHDEAKSAAASKAATSAPPPSASAADSLDPATKASPPTSAGAPTPASASAAPSAAPAATTTARGTRGHPTTKPKPDDCDPPYTIDADGHKAYKRHCLK